MQNQNKQFTRRAPQKLRFIGLMGIGLCFVTAGCGESDKSAGDIAKSATDSVAKKSSDIKDAVVGKEETRAELEARLSSAAVDYQNKIDKLEQSLSTETVPAFIEADKKRIESLKLSLHESNEKLEAVKKATEADWLSKRDLAIESFESTRLKIIEIQEREVFKKDVNQKLTKIRSKIENLRADAAVATTPEKLKLEEKRSMLEEKYIELTSEYEKFQMATEEKWTSFQAEMSKSFKSISEAFQGLFE